MSESLKKEELLLLSLLKAVLCNDNMGVSVPDGIDWEEIFVIAESHAVLPLLYDVLQDRNIPEYLLKHLNMVSLRTVRQSYRLLFLSRELVSLFETEGIFCVLLKGIGASKGYPVPELRKSGDIDLLIEPESLVAAENLLIKNGYFKSDEQHSNHHVVYCSTEGIEVELHTMLTEPFDDGQTNQYLKNLVAEYKDHCIYKDVMGVAVKVPDDAYFAFQLLLHMLHHFLRAGFGLKLLCDWVAFWNASVTEQSKRVYLKLVTDSKLKGFSDIITAVCINTLGLCKDEVSFMFEGYNLPDETLTNEFVREILEAEEFGNSSKDRMVIMRGTGIKDYAREFHHQMQLNFPKSGKLFIVWPFTWSVTMVRFLVNNKRIRNISTIEVLKKAHARSKLMKNIALFQKKI